MKKLLSALLALCLTLSLCAPALAAGESLDHFKATEVYADQFQDVAADAWYLQSVKTCYEYGLMKGASAVAFNPDGVLSVAEALVMADRVHGIFTDGESTLTNGTPWYQPYVDYALEKGLIQAEDFSDYTAKVTRAQMAYIFYHSLPASALPAINDVLSLPDVDASALYSEEVFALYDAGVLTGSDIYGTCKPDSTITRAEAAAIISRVAIPAQRKTFTLLKQQTLGSEVVLALPQGAQADSSSGIPTFLDLETGSGAIINSSTDEAYRGMSITLLSAAEMTELLTSSFQASGLTLSDAVSTAVSFGAIKSYRTTGLFTDADGIKLQTVIYTYISSSTMHMICLVAAEQSDPALLQNMANYLSVASCTVSPKL